LNSPIENTKKAVIITGASGKIGLKILKVFLSLDFFVIAQYNTNEEVLNDFLENNPEVQDNVLLTSVDFHTNIEILASIMRDFQENICCLINCAAVFKKGNLKNIDSLLEILQVNDLVPLVLTDVYRKIIQKGNIINILDGNVYRFNKNFQNYRFSKRVLQNLTEETALIYAPDIRINGIAFGMLEEEKTQSNTLAKSREILKNEINEQSISSGIQFLLSNENITGQIIYLDNGVHLL